MRIYVLLGMLVCLTDCSKGNPIPEGSSACWNVKYGNVSRSSAIEVVTALSNRNGVIAGYPSSTEQRFSSGHEMVLLIVKGDGEVGDIFALYGNGRFQNEVSDYLEDADSENFVASRCRGNGRS